jgi:transposase
MSRTKILAVDRVIAMGLDVDASASVAIVLDVSSGEQVFEGRVAHEELEWRRFLTRFPGCRLWACYEAGGLGFHLCRMLRRLGVDGQVIAPSQVPKGAAHQQMKTDRRDALMLAQLYFHPPRSFVRIPTEQEEHDRQLLRTREQLVRDKTRTMNRIKSFMAFHRLPWPTGKTAWSQATRQLLRGLPLPDPALRISLDVLLNELAFLKDQIRTLDQQIVAVSQSDRYHDRCARLRQLSGVGWLCAMAFLTEVFRPEEFETAEALAAHIGFTPCQWSSAQRRHLGHITHWGSPLLRRLLIEAAWGWVRRDPKAAACFHKISAGKRPKTAIVGMARRLAIVLWAMTTREQDYAYRWAA